jgi:hypothetical protein
MDTICWFHMWISYLEFVYTFQLYPVYQESEKTLHSAHKLLLKMECNY